MTTSSQISKALISQDGHTAIVSISVSFLQRGGRKQVLSPPGTAPWSPSPRVDSALFKAVVRAHRWRQMLESGEYTSSAELAKAEKVNDSYLSRILRLTLLAQPESGPHQAPFAICPLPGNDNVVPFILLISLRQAIPSSFSDTQGTSVSIFTLTPVQIQRDPRSCAHRVFDRAVQLQLRHVEARYARYRQALPGLPCMKATMEIAARFTAPMSGMETGLAEPNRMTKGSSLLTTFP